MTDTPSFASIVPQSIPVSEDDSFEDIASRYFPKDTIPTMVSKLKATTTRMPTKTEIMHLYDRQLHLVCHHPGLWPDLLTKLDQLPAWKAIVDQDLDNPDMRAWAYSLDPNVTSLSLDMVMYSEEDVADHSIARFLRPATKIIQAMSEWMHREEDIPSTTISLSAAFATQDQSLPDRVLRERIKALGKLLSKIRAIIEFKTPNSLRKEDFREFLAAFNDMKKTFDNSFPVPFLWMDEYEELKAKIDKSMCQVCSRHYFCKS